MGAFKEYVLNEGTQASIIVKTGEDKYSMSYLQYDGSTVGKELIAYFNNDKDVKKLITASGEIRGIIGGEVEYYNDKKLLLKDVSEDKVVKEARYFSTYVYYWDGNSWLYTKGKIKSLEDVHQAL
jgi:hypothetical protein